MRHLPVAPGVGRRRLRPGRREAGPALSAGALGMRQAREEVLFFVQEDICVSVKRYLISDNLYACKSSVFIFRELNI